MPGMMEGVCDAPGKQRVIISVAIQEKKKKMRSCCISRLESEGRPDIPTVTQDHPKLPASFRSEDDAGANVMWPFFLSEYSAGPRGVAVGERGGATHLKRTGLRQSMSSNLVTASHPKSHTGQLDRAACNFVFVFRVHGVLADAKT